jgi:uncharacterized protein YuzE
VVQSLYDDESDLLYACLYDQKQDVINRRCGEDVVSDIGEGDTIVGIDILNSSKRLGSELMAEDALRHLVTSLGQAAEERGIREDEYLDAIVEEA